MVREYDRDELIAAIRTNGPALIERSYRSETDLSPLIYESVKGNTFRSFQGLSRPPSKIFREWALSRLSDCGMRELSGIADQASYDALLDRLFSDLTAHWAAEGKKPLRCGPGRKLLDLLFKNVVKHTDIESDDRGRLIHLLHVPLDKYSLAAVRPIAATDEFGPPIIIPPDAKMGFVATPEQYNRLQRLMRGIAAAADAPPICIDLIAWNDAHGL